MLHLSACDTGGTISHCLCTMSELLFGGGGDEYICKNAHFGWVFLMTCKKMAVQFLYDMRSIIKNDSCFLVAYLLSCKFLCWKGTDMSDYYWYACMLGHIQMTADKSHRLWILCSSFFPLKNKQKELSSC